MTNPHTSRLAEECDQAITRCEFCLCRGHNWLDCPSWEAFISHELREFWVERIVAWCVPVAGLAFMLGYWVRVLTQ
jgi:hypothetical protein